MSVVVSSSGLSRQVSRRSPVQSLDHPSGRSGLPSDPGRLSLLPPERVRVRRPRFAPHPVRAAVSRWVPRLVAVVSSVPVLLGVAGVGFSVFVLVEAMFPTAAAWSGPRVVMGVSAVVVWCGVAGLVARVLARCGVGRGGRR